MSMYVVIAVTVLIAGFVQGATGLGFALISGPVVGMVAPRLLPVFLLILVGMLEFGFIFDHTMTISYATREGARSGSAFASGNSTTMICNPADGGLDVDKNIVAAVQRVLEAPGSQVVLSRVQEIRIYKATASGTQSGGSANVWTYSAGSGPVVDGQPLDEPYVYEDLPFTPGTLDCSSSPRSPRCFPEITVPRENLIVLGDHRSESADSVIGCRGATDGPECARFVPKDRVVGPVVLRFWPLTDVGGIAH